MCFFLRMIQVDGKSRFHLHHVSSRSFKWDVLRGPRSFWENLMKYVDLEQGKNGRKFAMFMYERNFFKKKLLVCLLYIVDEMIPSNVGIIVNYLVVSKICLVHPYLGKWANLTNIFQMGWNHQLVNHYKDPYETPSISMESKGIEPRPTPEWR